MRFLHGSGAGDLAGFKPETFVKTEGSKAAFSAPQNVVFEPSGAECGQSVVSGREGKRLGACSRFVLVR